ncbi:uncharacterized protein LOC115034910 [Acyrthosiphon pisum]|uniref:Uncharacterized protein n=1 Tax=Acyrthosiphon pisum TaxID=7029 RepID=A0A8R2NX26_ACYPI|nr:uncharacterized protein LOC115034910 [Acyrthosiphon pisum]
MGFKHECGLYNYFYVMQFGTFEEFIDHVKTKIIIVDGNIEPVPKKTVKNTLVDSDHPESTKSDEKIKTNDDTDSNEILPNKIIDHANSGNQDDGTSKISENKTTDTAVDNNVTLPETISNLIFNLYKKNSIQVKIERLSWTYRLSCRSAYDPPVITMGFFIGDNHIRGSQ